MTPSQEQRDQINALVARFEADTGIQAVAAITAKADAYPDIPWKAYAMGSAIGALATALNPYLVAGWSHAGIIALDAMLILSAGAVLAVLAAFVPPFARLFLNRVRAQGEAVQYAQSLFLARELFRTRDRRAVLVVMCCFERVAVVLTDSGLTQYASAAALEQVARTAQASFARRGLVPAFEAAFGRLGEVLKQTGFTASPAGHDEIADELVVEKRT